MKAFSGDNPLCVKCGYGKAGFQYETLTRVAAGRCEWLVRACMRCGYRWNEQCADAVADDRVEVPPPAWNLDEPPF